MSLWSRVASLLKTSPGAIALSDHGPRDLDRLIKSAGTSSGDLTLKDPRGWSWARLGTFSGDSEDYIGRAGNLWEHSIPRIGLGWLIRNFVEPPLNVCRRAPDSADAVPIPKHRMTLMLQRPNPLYDGTALMSGVVLSLVCNGNAYIWKQRSTSGKIVRLWYLPHIAVNVVRSFEEIDQPIEGYWVTFHGKSFKVEVEDMIHLRHGIDPMRPWMGLGILDSVVREIVSDSQATAFTVGLLKNFGVPTVIFSPEGDDIDDIALKELASSIREQFSGDRAGKALLVGTPIKAAKIGFSPDEMALDKVRYYVEARICAALGIPPMVLGLAVGDRQKTYSNLKEANRQGYYDAVIPLQELVARRLEFDLLDELGDLERECVQWDRRRIPSLSEDSNDTSKRALAEYQGGLRTKNEARAMINLPPDPDGGDEYFQSQSSDGFGETDDVPEADDEGDDEAEDSEGPKKPKVAA